MCIVWYSDGDDVAPASGDEDMDEDKEFDEVDSAAHCNTRHCSTRHCNTLQHTATFATRCNTLPHTATHCNTKECDTRHCNTLQHTTLQHIATHCNTLQHTTLQHTAAHCNTRHCNTRHCNTRQAAMKIWMKTRSVTRQTHCRTRPATHGNILQHTATYDTAAHCNTLQHSQTPKNTTQVQKI